LKFLPLLIALALSAMATAAAHLLPAARELRTLALVLDWAPFAAVFAVTAFTIAQLRRASVPLSGLLLAAYGFFAGALISTLGMAHLVAVVLTSINRGRHHQFQYTFHVYSLLLLGVLLVTAGLVAAIQANSLRPGSSRAWRASLAVWSAILAINLPLVPIQGFAVLFSVLAASALVLLYGMRRHFAGSA
jgi:hypothetical protein